MDERLPVNMNLHESGTLYTLLLRALMDDGTVSAGGVRRQGITVGESNLIMLLNRLGEVNDKLMAETAQ